MTPGRLSGVSAPRLCLKHVWTLVRVAWPITLTTGCMTPLSVMPGQVLRVHHGHWMMNDEPMGTHSDRVTSSPISAPWKIISKIQIKFYLENTVMTWVLPSSSWKSLFFFILVLHGNHYV